MQVYTPTPWYVTDKNPFVIGHLGPQGTYQAVARMQAHRGHDLIGMIHGSPKESITEVEAAANARFVVLAVNHHDDLVLSLSRALRYLDVSGFGSCWPHASKTANDLLDLIEKEDTDVRK